MKRHPCNHVTDPVPKFMTSTSRVKGNDLMAKVGEGVIQK